MAYLDEFATHPKRSLVVTLVQHKMSLSGGVDSNAR
jgi:hypothetical protein